MPVIVANGRKLCNLPEEAKFRLTKNLVAKLLAAIAQELDARSARKLKERALKTGNHTRNKNDDIDSDKRAGARVGSFQSSLGFLAMVLRPIGSSGASCLLPPVFGKGS